MSEYRIFRVIRTEGQRYFDIEYVQDLVACAECIHFTKLSDGWGRCNVHSRTAQTIDFCSWAERKENE